jgi:hypothetical protein
MLPSIVMLCVAVIVLGAATPKPSGWVALALGVLALLAAALGPHFLR